MVFRNLISLFKNMENTKTFARVLKEKGWSTSIQPKRAIEQASNNRLTISNRTGWEGIYSKYGCVSAKDIPILALACKITEKEDTQKAFSDDGRLIQEYALHKDGTWEITKCEPKADFIEDLVKIHISELLRLQGIHPTLDAYINWRLTLPKGPTL